MKNFFLHPFLISLYPVLFLYNFNKNELNLSVLVGPVLFVILLSCVIAAIFYLFFKSWSKAFIATSCLLIFSFSYGHIQNFIKSVNLPLGVVKIGADKILYVSFCVLVFFGLITIKKTRKKLERVNSFLNIVAVVIVVSSLYSIVTFELNHLDRYFPKVPEIKPAKGKKIISNDAPDIYYLIFDRYANGATLKKYYQFDNSQFYRYLEDKGFYIAQKSYANYPKTHLSLASSLNMEHITYLKEQAGRRSKDHTIVFRMLENTKVGRFLHDKGYKFLFFGSRWTPMMFNKYADENYNFYGRGNEFSRELFKTTILYPLFLKYWPDNFFVRLTSDEAVLKSTLFMVEKIIEVAKTKKAKFVFAHMLVSHDPYVLDENGRVMPEAEYKKLSLDERYVNQIKFTNKQIKILVEGILKNSRIPPIIIIQSDEGPFTEVFGRHGETIDWLTMKDVDLQLHLRILNAAYLPDFDKKKLYDSVTPVNTFRLIFNQYFKTSFSLLPDRSYTMQFLLYPYDFHDITSRVKF